MNTDTVSRHMAKKLQTILPRLAGSHPPSSLDGPIPIDLSIAENSLLRDETLALIKDSINSEIKPEHLDYSSFCGSPELLSALAALFNNYFHPSIPVEPNHLVAASGAGNALDALLFTLCDDGDKVLVVGPCWDGFANYFLVHANVEAVVVNAPSFDAAMGFDIVGAVKDAYQNATDPTRIKAVVFTNPNNPLGQCYPPEVIRECLRFCSSRGMHFISDEVYALSSFQSHLNLPPFVSVLSLLSDNPETDIEGRHSSAKLINPSHVHVVWSLSKDLGCAGLRLGCVVSQADQALRVGVGLSSYWQVSSLTSMVATSLLSPSNLPSLRKLNSERLLESYRVLTEGLTRLKIRYFSANAGLFVLAKLAPHAQSWEDERTALEKLAKAGLFVMAGQRLGGLDKEIGWMRITFASPPNIIEEALKRIETYLSAESNIGGDVIIDIVDLQPADQATFASGSSNKKETKPSALFVENEQRTTEMTGVHEAELAIRGTVTNKYDQLSRTPSPDDSTSSGTVSSVNSSKH